MTATALGFGGRLALAALLGLVTTGCANRRAKPRTHHVGLVANGRPDTCPENAVDAGDGTAPGPMDLRCSYADAAGAVLTRIKGHVLHEGAPGSLGESPGRITVEVYRAPRALDGPLGAKVAEATTDPQGAFSVSATLDRGDYVLVVPGSGPRPLVRQRVAVGGDAGHRIEGLHLMIPRPMDESPEGT